MVPHSRHKDCATFSLKRCSFKVTNRLDGGGDFSVMLLYVFNFHLSGLSSYRINHSNVIYMFIFSLGTYTCHCGHKNCFEPWNKVFDAPFTLRQTFPFEGAPGLPFTFAGKQWQLLQNVGEGWEEEGESCGMEGHF